jgi:hypothetical protein
MSYAPGLAQVAVVDKQLLQRDTFLGEIRERLLQAQDHMKEQHDNSHQDVEFAVGDHRMAAGIMERTNAKLSPNFFGPFQVREHVGELAYRLQLPPKARIHVVFHVVFLKKFEGAPPTAPPRLSPLNHGRDLPVPSRVLRARRTATSWEIQERVEQKIGPRAQSLLGRASRL